MGLSGLARPQSSILPEWLNPEVFLSDPALAPWIVLIICGIVFAETGLLVGFFLPGDSLLFTAGLLVATDTIKVNVLLLSGLIFVCAFAGDQLGYYFGRKAGPAIFNKPESRFFRREYVESAHAFFLKHGGKAVVLARFVPIIRTFTPVVAGVAHMPYRTFIFYNLIGALLWGVGVTLLGFFLGNAVPAIRDYLDIIFVLIVLISILPMVYELFRSHRSSRRSSAAAPAED